MIRVHRDRNESRDRITPAPTLSDIRRRAARVRANWTDDERARRREISPRVAHFWEIVLTPSGE